MPIRDMQAESVLMKFMNYIRIFYDQISQFLYIFLLKLCCLDLVHAHEKKKFMNKKIFSVNVMKGMSKPLRIFDENEKMLSLLMEKEV